MPVSPVDNETIKSWPIFLKKIIIHDRRLPFYPGSLFWRQLLELTLYLTCTDLGMKSGLLTEVTPRLSLSVQQLPSSLYSPPSQGAS